MSEKECNKPNCCLNNQEQPKKRGRKIKFVGKKKNDKSQNSTSLVVKNVGSKYSSINVPQFIFDNPELTKALSILPSNYNFEIPKTIWRILDSGYKRVALQFPEGLQMYACVISDILKKFCEPTLEDILIMGDVTYGACCIDDFTAKALDCDFIVHYGHSCLIPLTETAINTLYVFVDIAIDVNHFVESMKITFPDKSKKIALVGTIQFIKSLQLAAKQLNTYFETPVIIPQEKPLSPGEILGCTSPKLSSDVDILVYIGDGRFHLESIMISNPKIKSYRYDPYSKKFTIEGYDTESMFSTRQDAINVAKKARKVGIILGTLGRQGSVSVLKRLEENLKRCNIEYIIVLLSEIFPSKLDLFNDIDAWIQVACPRLSIDWGYSFSKPLLNPYEAYVAYGGESWKSVYPMDYYSKQGGSWSVYSK